MPSPFYSANRILRPSASAFHDWIGHTGPIQRIISLLISLINELGLVFELGQGSRRDKLDV